MQNEVAERPKTPLEIIANNFCPPAGGGSGGDYWHQISGLVPEGINAAEVASNWFSAVQGAMSNPETSRAWSSVGADSLRTTLMQCASMGMYPGPQGHVYLIPYGGVATLIVGYKGLISLMKRSGTVEMADADVVFESDEFVYQRGLHPKLHHVPNLARSLDEPIVAAYAVAHYRSGASQFVVMTAGEIERLKRQFGGKSKSPWGTHTDRMARKSALRQLFNLVGIDAASPKALNAHAIATQLVDNEVLGGQLPRLEAPSQAAGKPMRPAFAMPADSTGETQ